MSSHNPGIEVRRGRRGRGVFATRDFKEGEVIETCPTVLFADDEVDGPIRDYLFTARQPGKVLMAFGYGMLYNHAAQPNMYHRAAGRLMMEFVAGRDIEAGEELTHDYGGEYWTDRPIAPK